MEAHPDFVFIRNVSGLLSRALPFPHAACLAQLLLLSALPVRNREILALL